jgi:hypothetical protein
MARQADRWTLLPFPRNKAPSISRYFFHVTHDGSSVDDTEGVELPDRTEAWLGATGAWREFIREFNGEFETGDSLAGGRARSGWTALSHKLRGGNSSLTSFTNVFLRPGTTSPTN